MSRGIIGITAKRAAAFCASRAPRGRMGERLKPVEGDEAEPQIFAVGAFLVLYGFTWGIAVCAVATIFF